MLRIYEYIRVINASSINIFTSYEKNDYNKRRDSKNKNIKKYIRYYKREYSLTYFFRICKYNENSTHIRPIKIILGNETECQNILNNVNKLKNSKYSIIIISKEYNKEELANIK